jgi:soluble lytic murein transglycosylase-like protein
MKLSSTIAIAALLAAAQGSALAAEVAVLRNGFAIRCERREQIGDMMRLYTTSGYIDVPASEITAFEKDDTPVAPILAAPVQVAPVPTSVNPTVKASSQPLQPGITNVSESSAITLKPDIGQLVRDASDRNRLDPDFVNSVIKAESGFQTRAVSRKGAQGLMQLMPGTAAQLGVSDAFDPKANVDAGTAYLSSLLDQYNDDPIKALAAYNAGPHRVDQYHGVPPYTETRAYVARIVRDFNAKKRAQMKATGSPSKSTGTTAKPAQKTQAAQSSPATD